MTELSKHISIDDIIKLLEEAKKEWNVEGFQTRREPVEVPIEETGLYESNFKNYKPGPILTITIDLKMKTADEHID